ncbi:putative integral membrane protein [Aspergillus undulatus]|uniref:putative integral membrane protein n=1 Tax=Aspergillus undulatus TaxID=1810928 RepID=UPI003CCCE8B1
MASQLLNSPHKLLLTPLISSTGTLMYAGCEALFYSAFLHSPVRPHSRLSYRVDCSGSSTGTFTFFIEDLVVWKGSRGFFVSGLIGTCAHFVFAPTMLGIIDNITLTEERKEGDCTDDMGRWLNVHYLRFAVADVPAWVAYIGAVLTTLSI